MSYQGPVGLGIRLWDFLSLSGSGHTLRTCKLSLCGNLLCSTFIPEQDLEKCGYEAEVERWLLTGHARQKAQLPREWPCRNRTSQRILEALGMETI